MKTTTLILCLILCSASLFGQPNTRKYVSLIRDADSLYREKEFKKSAFAFSAAFKAPDSRITVNHR